MPTPPHQQDQDLARRIYAYFVFRLRQPEEAERLTRLAFERIWERERLSRDVDQEPEVPLFAAARAVIAENPRPRVKSKVSRAAPEVGEGPTGLSNQRAMAMGRLDGREREALALRFGGELSVGEIAHLIDRTPAEVKQRLARGARGLLELGVLPKESEARSASERPGARGTEKGEAQQEQADQ